MKQLAVYSMLGIMLVLAGCPLMTDNSIDEGSYDVPGWLPGKWAEIDSAGKIKDVYLLKKEDKMGNLKCYDVDADGKPNMDKPRHVILSKVGDKVFMSVFNPGDDVSDDGYYVFLFTKQSNKEFTLKGVKEHAIRSNAPPKEIREFLEKNKDEPGIYDPKDVLRYKKQ